MQQAQTEEKKKAEGRFTSELFSWGESLMAVLIFFVVIFTFFVRLIGVDGTSMYPTLQDHSVMLASNLGYTPKKGDVVVLNKIQDWSGAAVGVEAGVACRLSEKCIGDVKAER